MKSTTYVVRKERLDLAHSEQDQGLTQTVPALVPPIVAHGGTSGTPAGGQLGATLAYPKVPHLS
jgi:hypothetical protein